MQISMPSLYRVRRADIPACAALAARAFAFDASLRFQMGGREPSFRKRKLFFQVMLLSWWQTGELFATSNALEGIICFSAGESDGIPMRAFLRAGGWKLPLAVHPLIFRNIRRYEAQNAAMRSAKGGARGAWALNLLAVDPARQGRGIWSGHDARADKRTRPSKRKMLPRNRKAGKPAVLRTVRLLRHRRIRKSGRRSIPVRDAAQSQVRDLNSEDVRRAFRTSSLDRGMVFRGKLIRNLRPAARRSLLRPCGL